MTSVKLLMTLSHAGIEVCDLHVSGRELNAVLHWAVTPPLPCYGVWGKAWSLLNTCRALGPTSSTSKKRRGGGEERTEKEKELYVTLWISVPWNKWLPWPLLALFFLYRVLFFPLLITWLEVFSYWPIMLFLINDKKEKILLFLFTPSGSWLHIVFCISQLEVT